MKIPLIKKEPPVLVLLDLLRSDQDGCGWLVCKICFDKLRNMF